MVGSAGMAGLPVGTTDIPGFRGILWDRMAALVHVGHMVSVRMDRFWQNCRFLSFLLLVVVSEIGLVMFFYM